MDIGERIAFYRKLKGLSKKQLAEKCGYHQSVIGKIEVGLRQPSSASIPYICEALGITPNELYNISEQEDKNEQCNKSGFSKD